jgi:hypothetical protein
MPGILVLHDLAWLAILALAFAAFLYVATKPFEEAQRDARRQAAFKETLDKVSAVYDQPPHRET